ncbi:unnamed protein product [Clonostachys solani]|uniref:Post-SET domain-containing protein n=1 Tax=Clonostachys solani TaxID=160281 RepID=A0A9N9W621_9HYPO|nr:unnamed protein product [Clonostachys solani]
MAPLKPHWPQPSHPGIQEVVINEAEFTSKSLSKVSLPPFAVFSKLSFPPCSAAPEPTYATVQMGKDKHLNLNSDLLYINHSCDPSLIFDTTNFNILVGPNGLKPGDELTFFYPSTEWSMAQPFECLCGTSRCRGTIAGAKDMTHSKLEGYWLNTHIRELLENQRLENGTAALNDSNDPTAQALKDALSHAEQVVEAARTALRTYAESATVNGSRYAPSINGQFENGLGRRGLTSRELAGEMGGDTSRA